jgi:hypothetical protein
MLASLNRDASGCFKRENNMKIRVKNNEIRSYVHEMAPVKLRNVLHVEVVVMTKFQNK